MGNPTITERKHVHWLPDPPSEPTSTLVLTSHTSHYVDIRVYKSTSQSGLLEDLPNDGGPMPSLEWAFAGTSVTTKAPDSDVMHTVWSHWIDSKSADPPEDEGDMYVLPNGDTLERGVGISPYTGKMTTYEELWHDLDIDTIGAETQRICIVLTSESFDLGAKGMIIRIGGWCQGIMQSGTNMTIERWKWVPETPSRTESKEILDQDDNTSGKSIDGGAWERMVRLGSGYLPCSVTFQTDLVKDGGTVTFGDLQWMVVEIHRW